MVKFTFKQSSVLTTKYENSLFNTASGAMKKLAKQLGMAKGSLQRLQNIEARRWAGFVQESVRRQIAEGIWRKRPKALSERYAARKAAADPTLDPGILRAVNPFGLVSGLVAEFPGGGVASVSYQGQSSSPFNKARYKTKPRATSTRSRDTAREFKKTAGGTYGQVMLLSNLASVMEFGNKTIPARPFFGPAIEYATMAVARGLEDDVYAALFGGDKEMAKLTKLVRSQIMKAYD